MNAKVLGVSAGVAAVLALTTVSLKASDPVGVYCVVQKVVMAPDEVQPTTVQVWGACTLAIGGMADDRTYTPGWYSQPQAGYLYYSLPGGKEELARKEWKDLKSVAGTGEIVAFGGRYMKVGRMRWADEKPNAPDAYPIQMGVTKMSNVRVPTDAPGFSYTALFAALKNAAGVK